MAHVLVLCYHALSPTWPAALSTTQERFAEQLDRLQARGYRGVTFSEAVTRPAAGRARTVAVTFDDAFASVATLGRPVLDGIGWPATVFAPTDWPDAGRPMTWPGIEEWLGGPHEHELRPLSWDGLRELRDAGWEVGSHTRSHPHLTRLDDIRLAEELVRSREVCEQKLGGCSSIAYPYGDVDERVIAATAVAGYGTGAALPARPHAARPLEWPRVGVYNIDDLRRFAAKTSPLVWRARRLTARLR